MSSEVLGYINAGGRGTRLASLFTPDEELGIAKALLEIGHPPVKLIDHHIANLREQGIDSIVVAAGDQPSVYQHVVDTYADDPRITATHSPRLVGNGGDLVTFARQLPEPTDILIQNVDTILDIDLQRFYSEFSGRKHLGAAASIALTLNRGVPNQDAFLVDSTGKVVYSAEFNAPSNDKPYEYAASSAGAVVVESPFLTSHRWTYQDGQLSLYRDCLRTAWEDDRLFAYNNQYGFFRDVGTTATWLASETDIELQQLLRYNQVQ